MRLLFRISVHSYTLYQTVMLLLMLYPVSPWNSITIFPLFIIFSSSLIIQITSKSPPWAKCLLIVSSSFANLLYGELIYWILFFVSFLRLRARCYTSSYSLYPLWLFSLRDTQQIFG